MFLSACSSDVFNSETKRRHPGVQTPIPTEDVSTAIPLPELVLSQELKNCDQTQQGCEQQNFQVSNPDPYTVNSLIVSNSENLTNTNLLNAPAIKFELKNIDQSLIQSVAYSYCKKDFFGNTIIQTDLYNIYEEEGYYYVPIHSNKMGTGVLMSSPSESHIIKIKVVFDNNRTHSQDLRFFLQTNTVNPVLISRDTEISNSSYYKMDSIQSTNIIDAVMLKNTLPYNVELSGNIEVNNKTLAFLSRTSKVQHHEFKICTQPSYSSPCDYYEHSYTNAQEYEGALGTPFYSLRILRGANYIEIPSSATVSGHEIILSFDNMEILANEEIKMELVANFNINNNLVGDHGTVNIFTGRSYCEDPSSMDCYCFYELKQTVGYIWFAYGISFMDSIRGSIYPSCNTDHPGFPVAEQNLSVAQYPSYNIALVGRKHLTNTKYSISSWLKGFDPSNNFGTLTKTMDPLESNKGFSDESALLNSMNYEGFIPGEL
jgi:hypothetical protein